MGKVILLELYKKFKFDNTNKWYMHNTGSVQENGTHKILCDFETQTDHQISARRQDLRDSQQKKKRRTRRIVDFAVSADHKVKLKESEKSDNFQNLVRELKKLWNMEVAVVPIVIGALGTVAKGLVQGLEDLEITGRVESMPTTALLRSARILRIVLKTWGDLLSLGPQWKTIN